MAKRGLVPLAAALVALAGASVAGANVPLTQSATDPLHELHQPARDRGRARHLRLGEHRSSSAFQVGRFFDGGATDIGFATSADGGVTWDDAGFLPGLTFSVRAPASRSSASAIPASPSTPRHDVG